MQNPSKNFIQSEIEKFLKFEEAFLKEKIKISKFLVWPLIRQGVYELIFSHKNLSLGTSIDRKKNFNISKTLVSFLKNISLLPKDLFSLKGIFKKSEVLIINVSPKRVEIDGDYTNPSLWNLTQSLKNYEISILNTQSVDLRIKGINKIDISYLLKIFTRLSKIFYLIDRQWKDSEKIFSEKVKKNYDLNLNWKDIYSQIFKRNQYTSFFVELIIKFSKPKIIIYNDNGILNASINVAFNKKIPTVDYQHGLLSNYYVLYNHNQFIDQDYKNYLSDYYLAWGSFRLSSYNKNYLTRVGGNPFFEKKLKEYKFVKEEKNSILFISDGKTTKKVLQELALYLNKELDDYKIFYKLRPEEYQTWQEEYSLLEKISNSIYVIQDDDIDIYYYFKKCEFVIGTNSTALVEAIPFSEVLVYKKGWYFELEDYISKKLMRDFESKQDFLSFFNSNISEKKKNNMPELKPDFSEKIFCKNSEEQINFEISKIIETHISNG
tara:strand:- start:1808 stop:3283 length:1476 start_codon:yes stop_codon:yes gene_type:complete